LASLPNGVQNWRDHNNNAPLSKEKSDKFAYFVVVFLAPVFMFSHKVRKDILFKIIRIDL